jgi:hypothetical protein
VFEKAGQPTDILVTLAISFSALLSWEIWGQLAVPPFFSTGWLPLLLTSV